MSTLDLERDEEYGLGGDARKLLVASFRKVTGTCRALQPPSGTSGRSRPRILVLDAA